MFHDLFNKVIRRRCRKHCTLDVHRSLSSCGSELRTVGVGSPDAFAELAKLWCSYLKNKGQNESGL